MFYDNWINLNIWKFINPTTIVSIYRQFGYLSSNNVTEVVVNYHKFEQIPLLDKAKETLDGIVERCKNKG